MRATARRAGVLMLVLASLIGIRHAAAADASAPPYALSPSATTARTPPRLSYIDGEVSFWRRGATQWVAGQINTPLTPGDELSTGQRGNVELQAGARLFVRAASQTHFGIANQEPDFLQLTLAVGHLALDVRRLEPDQSVELDTPHATFTIDHAGYYWADVTDEGTVFIARRGGQATMTSAGSQAMLIAPNEAVLLQGRDRPQVQRYLAPALDPWDQWNYARTDGVFEALSARYVSPGTYGLDELDHHGHWRMVAEYGAVWVPVGVPSGWAPYSTGRWIIDPDYGWTWVDTAPWGWAPYHYGRWVFVNGRWAWAPGPLGVRAVYAPALVAFFSAPVVRASVDIAPAVSWVALGWGEPIVPWWGRPGFIGCPWWGGWGGPRVINDVVLNRTTVVNLNTVTVYRNASIANAVVAVRQEHLAARPVQAARIADVAVKRLEPVRGALRVSAEPASVLAASGPAVRPPDPPFPRRRVAARPPAHGEAGTRAAPRPDAGTRPAAPAPPVVVIAPAPSFLQSPRPALATAAPSRAPSGAREAEGQRASLSPTSPGSARREVMTAIVPPGARHPNLPAPPATRLSPARVPAELHAAAGPLRELRAGGRPVSNPSPPRDRHR